MSWFGGSDSTTTDRSTSINEEITKTLVDYSQLDEGSNQSKIIADLRDVSNVDLSILDGGAIKESFDFAGNALEQVLSVEERALQAIDDSSQRETSTAMFALSKATTLDGAQLTTEKLLLYGSVVGAIAIIFYFVKRG